MIRVLEPENQPWPGAVEWVSEVIDILDSSGHFDELMAEGSDDMDIDNDYESHNLFNKTKLLKLQFYNIIELDGMDAEEPPSDDTSHSSEPVISQPADVCMALC